ncbi:MAG TPA: TIGR01777 family oxidoreductase [Solirubrobacterales bacterium]|jgi:uncharacterized protein (TIGR01777 family)
MRVLVTGASGLLGSAVCDALLARGDEVVGLTRDPDRARPKNPTVTWHAWSPTTERPPEAALDEIDAVVNLIGEEINQRLTDQAKIRIRESRIVGTRNLLQGIAASPTEPSVFVGQSAIGYYGDRGEQIIDEESDPGDPGFITEVVSDWEGAERQAEDVFDRVVIFRTGLVLTKDGGLLKQLLLPFKLGVGGPIAGGDQYMSWIHIEDVVGLFLWALDDHRVWGVINATAPDPATNREFSKALGRAVHRPAIAPVPKFAVAALRGGELADAVAGGARVVPRRALDLGYEFRHTDLDEALGAALR